jgi:hypothetical protein
MFLTFSPNFYRSKAARGLYIRGKKTASFMARVSSGCSVFSFRIARGVSSAFSLVEFILTVSVLSVGIVFVIRSFLSASSVVSYAGHRIKAVYAAEKALNESRQQALQDGGLSETGFETLKISLDAKEAVCSIEAAQLDESLPALLSVSARVLWTEGDKAKDAGVWTCMLKKEQL